MERLTTVVPRPDPPRTWSSIRYLTLPASERGSSNVVHVTLYHLRRRRCFTSPVGVSTLWLRVSTLHRMSPRVTLTYWLTVWVQKESVWSRKTNVTYKVRPLYDLSRTSHHSSHPVHGGVPRHPTVLLTPWDGGKSPVPRSQRYNKTLLTLLGHFISEQVESLHRSL